MNGHQNIEQLTEQFQSLCRQVPAAFKINSQDQRSLEKNRLAVIKAAQDCLKLLQTHDELATQQTWMVRGPAIYVHSCSFSFSANLSFRKAWLMFEYT